MSNLDKAVELLKEKKDVLKSLRTDCEHEFSCGCNNRLYKAETRYEQIEKLLECFTPALLEQAYGVLQREEAEVLRRHELVANAYRQKPQELDLHTLFPDLDCSDSSGYCRSRSTENNPNTYSTWEDTVANPAIDAAGYDRLWCWVNGDGDSFGPLWRKVLVMKDNRYYEIAYG